jgi:hypothetical protein
VTTISKVNNVPQSKRLRDLYRRREQVVQAIRALEQIQDLRSRRSASMLPSLLALGRNLSASFQEKLAA